MQQQILDISVPITTHTVVWPDDPPVSQRNIGDDDVRVTEVTMSVHTGTHIDAPAHYLDHGATIDQLALHATMGPCVVLDLTHVGPRITPEHLVRFNLRPGSRVLLRTTNSTRHLWTHKEFAADFAHLTPEAAAYLTTLQVQCIGIDYVSIGGMSDGAETHRTLLGAGVWIIEGLDLRAIEPGEYELIALPLRLEGLEAAPARVVLRGLEADGTIDFVDDAVEYASKTG